MAIVGPTGAGKSTLALRMAERLDGEVVNCDSMQIYTGFDIGTAKLPEAERRGIAHHLLGTVDPRQSFSAGDWARAARHAIAGIAARGRVALLVGGTGFYLRALLEGLPELPTRDDAFRARLERRSAPRLHRMLARLDPAAFHRLHPNDRTRVVRAIEIRILAGKAAPPRDPSLALSGYTIHKFALLPPRESLYERLNRRTEEMFRGGLPAEVESLLAQGVPRDAKPFDAVGYRQALALVEGRLPFQAALAQAQQATRNYAKRQFTWFRHEPGVHILPQFGEETQPPLPGI